MVVRKRPRVIRSWLPIEGLKLVKAPTQYPELEADEAMLRSIGIEELYDFSEDDLVPKADNLLTDESQQIMQSNNNNGLPTDDQLGQLPASNNITATSTRPSSPQHKPFGLTTEYMGEASIFQYLDQLEAQAKNVLAVLGEIRSKVTRALQQPSQNQ